MALGTTATSARRRQCSRGANCSLRRKRERESEKVKSPSSPSPYKYQKILLFCFVFVDCALLSHDERARFPHLCTSAAAFYSSREPTVMRRQVQKAHLTGAGAVYFFPFNFALYFLTRCFNVLRHPIPGRDVAPFVFF